LGPEVLHQHTEATYLFAEDGLKYHDRRRKQVVGNRKTLLGESKDREKSYSWTGREERERKKILCKRR
jgi:hypothetical protein